MYVQTDFPLLDTILADYKGVIENDYEGYRNHCRRVLNYAYCLLDTVSPEDSEKLQIAVAFHDIALWTHDRVDYLEPSCAVARAYLIEQGLTAWEAEILRVIDMHHYTSAYTGEYQRLVEAFRQADLVDFSWGLIRFQLDKALIAAVKQAIPNAGFHRTLMRFTVKQLGRNALQPLPMLRFKNPYS